MDPAQVDKVINWKTPTNKDLCLQFRGTSVGYLADDIAQVRIPMSVLHHICGSTVPFRWGEVEDRAFDQIKEYTERCRSHHRVPLRYGPDAPPVNMVTDGCASGVSGVISQGTDWKTAGVAAFFSAKLSGAQQNYPAHEIEMPAGLKTMLRHRDILQGCPFTWYTDHKGLIHLLNQENLSGRQARWMEKLAEFDFKVEYVPGTENALADALSQIYSNDAPGTVRSPSEYTEFDDESTSKEPLRELISMPVLVWLEAPASLPRRAKGKALELRAIGVKGKGRALGRTAQTRSQEPNAVRDHPGSCQESKSSRGNKTDRRPRRSIEASINPEGPLYVKAL